MEFLLVASLIWAFSFSLIKTNFNGISPDFIAAARLGISLLVFLPFLRTRALERRVTLRLILTGGIQFGVMYIAYLYAFHYLKAFEVALFTVFTPIYVSLIHDILQQRVNGRHLLTAALAAAGTWVVQGGGAWPAGVLAGFLIVQVSNLCFAFGQVDYRNVVAGRQVDEQHIFAWLYLGGFLTAGLSTAIFTDWRHLIISGPQWLTLLYLGAIASGLGFFLWNVGARRVEAGTLAIFNDLKVPLAVAVSLLFFGERTDLLRLLAGGGVVLLALGLNEWGARRALPVAAAQESAGKAG